MSSGDDAVGQHMRQLASQAGPALRRLNQREAPARPGEQRSADSAREAVGRAERIYGVSESVHRAWACVDFDNARRQAELVDQKRTLPGEHGTLEGWTVGIKDVIDVQGFATAHGSSTPATLPDRDAPAVAALRSHGAIILGKTETHEHAYGLVTPQTRNTLDPERMAGGSSGGSAVAVATQMADVALGTDTGGSTRVPAALNGVVGFKPSYGRLSLEGVAALSPTLDHLGLLAGSVEDVRQVFSALDGRREHREAFDLHPRHDVVAGAIDLSVDTRIQYAVAQAYGRYTDVVRQLAVATRQVEIPGFDSVPAVHYGVMGPEASAALAVELADHRHLLGDTTRHLLEAGMTVPAVDYMNALALRQAMRDRWEMLFATIDVLALPTTPLTAPLHGEESILWPDGTTEPVTDALVRWCVPANIVGYPAISIPWGDDEKGLPIGMQLIARPGEDDFLLGFAQRIMEGTDPSE